MAYIYDIADTWSGGGAFTAIKMNVTDGGSGPNSLLMDLQVGGVSQLKVSKTGNICGTASNNFGTVYINGTSSGDAVLALGGPGAEGVTVRSSGFFAFSSATSPAHSNRDLVLLRDAANTLAQRNGVNAQAFNLYNTYTDASNYERARTGWNANVFEIFSEAAGTGTRRNLSIYATQTIIDGPADNSYSLRRNGVAQIFAGSAGPRFAQPIYPAATIVDIGLSSFPFRDIFLKPSASLTPNANGDLCIEATNNTTLTFKLKGSDGTVRSGTVTLA